MVGSSVGGVAGVEEFSWVGETISGITELVADSGGSAVGRLVAGRTGVRVLTGEEVAVAGTQAVRKASRVQVRKKRCCMLKLYS
jgi:hypothetical protein